ncbi:hypothetical protein K491DRAFT_715050 [Lophiostoma macrostomum CBS 122681]|uniref:Uncharacterized protein n=1 Tax=Lophiostoma macrostomum CBS 122681 TaxID=1314788 RepID=A0A6A6TC40_9PLEO|nr:hypothetical protein K491DRAFT_715050 [Lophiostoma macrostomum CBS 122681]
MSLSKFKSKLHSKINQGADHSSDTEQHGLVVDYGLSSSTSPNTSASASASPVAVSDPISEPASKPKKRIFQFREPGTQNAEALKAIVEKEKDAHPKTGPLTERELALEEQLEVPDVQRQGTPEERRKAIRERLRLQQDKNAGRMLWGC